MLGSAIRNLVSTAQRVSKPRIETHLASHRHIALPLITNYTSTRQFRMSAPAEAEVKLLKDEVTGEMVSKS